MKNSGMISKGLAYSTCLLLLVSCASTQTVQVPKVQEEAVARNERALDLNSRGKLQDAVTELTRALKINRAMDNRKGVVVNLLNIGRIYLTMGRFDDAKGVLEEAVSMSASIGDRLLMAEASATMGKYYYEKGDDNEAMKSLKDAVDTARSDGLKIIGASLNLTALIYMKSGRTKEAEDSFREGLSFNLKNTDYLETANSYRGIGDVLESKGESMAALEAFEKALDNDRMTGSSRKIALDLTRLGNLSLKGNRPNSALDYFLRAYDVDLNAGDKDAAVKDAANISKTYRKMGNEQKALFYDERRIELMK